jgi:hypothetical protein
MRELIHRLLSPFMSYGARHHFARRVRSFDYRFLAAVIAMIVAILLVIRFGA